ncbi:MAG TPA: hypothetical protein VMY37_17165 [Thermoguttaceae bacterium]|nr:hypothetical protein [Thermoguttaceae bacterium]HUU94697.1 hypothetical protein [Phycisphaerae bacterium]
MKHRIPHSRRDFLRISSLACGSLTLPRPLLSAEAQPVLPNFKSLTPEQQVGQSVGRVWKLKQELGLFEQRLVDPAQIPEVFAAKASAEIARRIARESVTLLENQLKPIRTADRPDVVVVISNGSTATVDEDNAVKHSPTNDRLNEQIRQRVPRAQRVVLSTAMKPEEIERAFAAAEQADVIVFGLFTRVRAYVEDAIKVAKPYTASPDNVARMSPCFLEENARIYLTTNIGPRLHQKIAFAVADAQNAQVKSPPIRNRP